MLDAAVPWCSLLGPCPAPDYSSSSRRPLCLARIVVPLLPDFSSPWSFCYALPPCSGLLHSRAPDVLPGARPSHRCSSSSDSPSHGGAHLPVLPVPARRGCPFLQPCSASLPAPLFISCAPWFWSQAPWPPRCSSLVLGRQVSLLYAFFFLPGSCALCAQLPFPHMRAYLAFLRAQRSAPARPCAPSSVRGPSLSSVLRFSFLCVVLAVP
uniref:Uncharacterized protein n=1 Tax=Zea mays TaxID=4577 RepID=B4FLM6_MAIZE|nr:unknown [Zea mays]